jgi:hypothetical protein
VSIRPERSAAGKTIVPVLRAADIQGGMMLAFYKRTPPDELRYYYVHDYQGGLFSPFALTTIWGKESERGRRREYSFENRSDMERKIRKILTTRARDGYKLLYSYPLVNSYHLLYQDIVQKTAG